MSGFLLAFGSAANARIQQKNIIAPGAFMRSVCSFVTVTALLMSSVAFADPLAPGKPAGVHAAQMGDKEWMVFGGIGLVVAGILVATNGSGSHAAVTTTPISVVTTS